MVWGEECMGDMDDLVINHLLHGGICHLLPVIVYIFQAIFVSIAPHGQKYIVLVLTKKTIPMFER